MNELARPRVILAMHEGETHRVPYVTDPYQVRGMLSRIGKACPVKLIRLVPRNDDVVIAYAEGVDDSPPFPCAALSPRAALQFVSR
jgi:hypothetical protein